jgi:TonB-dependent receptor
MGRFKFDRWTLLGGLRLEETKVRAAGRQIVLDAKGNVTGVTPAQTDRTYLEVLPGLHARFDPQSGWIVRSAVTRSLSRPNYSELAPTRQINFLDGRSRSGNPDLKPYAATNFDFSVDRYHERVGLVSVAVFFKKIDHFIADAQYPVTIGTLGQFIEFKRVNGDSARVGGAEFGWQSVKWPLPAGLGSANVVTNYTFLHSDTRIPQRPGEVFSLSKQSTHQGNVTLSAERGRFSVDATLRYRSKSLEDVIDPGFDNYRMGAFDAELGVVYKITKDTRLTLGVSNLLNVPMREYAGLRSRVNAYERSGVDINFGFQWKVPQRVGNVAGK